MPLLSTSTYRAPFWLPGGNAQTVYPPLFRCLSAPPHTVRRVPTPDGDWFSLDHYRAGMGGKRQVVILSHGMEGHSKRGYMIGMCGAFLAGGWDCLARNFRACGGEMNALPGMYHSGQTEDLHTAITLALAEGYTRIALVGFSMGGNQVLKYLGEAPERVPGEVAGAAAFSVPCDLQGCAMELARPGNRLYMRYFLRTLREKVRAKHREHPGFYPLKGLETITSFQEFDGRYTAPVHGFASARDYWKKSSCLPVLEGIRIPTLLVNARNDPFLSPSCSPASLARDHPFLTLERPRQGGHVGFTPANGMGRYWSEKRAVAFISSLQGNAVLSSKTSPTP